MAERLFFAVAVIMLSCSFIVAGFLCCCLPVTCSILTELTSDFDLSPYRHESLVMLAEETRSYTVCDYGRRDGGVETARLALSEKILEAALASTSDDSPTVDRWSKTALAAVAQCDGTRQDEEGGDSDTQTALSAQTLDASIQKLAKIDQSYALDSHALSHLDDVHALLSCAMPVSVLIVAGALFCLVAILRRCGKRLFSWTLIASGSAAVIFFVVCLLWAVIDFNGLFSFLHSFFFAEGTWTFAHDSLLICMYPTSFWLGMGTLWLVISCALSILSLVCGCFMGRCFDKNRRIKEKISSAKHGAKPHSAR